MRDRKISSIQPLPPLGGEHVATGIDFFSGRTTAKLDRDRNYWLYEQLALIQAEAQRPVGVLEPRRPFVLQADGCKHGRSLEQDRGTGAKPASACKALPTRGTARMPFALDHSFLAHLDPAAGIQRQRIVAPGLIFERVRKPPVQRIRQHIIVGIEKPDPLPGARRQSGIAPRAGAPGLLPAHDLDTRIGAQLAGQGDRRARAVIHNEDLELSLEILVQDRPDSPYDLLLSIEGRNYEGELRHLEPCVAPSVIWSRAGPDGPAARADPSFDDPVPT